MIFFGLSITSLGLAVDSSSASATLPASAASLLIFLAVSSVVEIITAAYSGLFPAGSSYGALNFFSFLALKLLLSCIAVSSRGVDEGTEKGGVRNGG